MAPTTQAADTTPPQQPRARNPQQRRRPSPAPKTRPAGDPPQRPVHPERQRQKGLVPPKLFKIGEVMRYTGLSRQTLHNYTVLGLISERRRTDSGHRLYGEEVFERLRRITELKGRMTLREIRKLLEEEDRKG